MSVTIHPLKWEVEVFFDGECPLCKREINFLQRWDRNQRILFTDIAAPGFQANDYGKDMPTLMAEIHGRLPDGQWIVGVEVFRRIYSALGLSTLVWVTRWPGISHLLALAYRSFAKHRLRLTGRCGSEGGSCQVKRASSASSR